MGRQKKRSNANLNSELFAVGIVVIFLAFVTMAMHPYPRGGARVRGTSANGPTWFVIILVGIALLVGFALMATAVYLPG